MTHHAQMCMQKTHSNIKSSTWREGNQNSMRIKQNSQINRKRFSGINNCAKKQLESIPVLTQPELPTRRMKSRT